MSLIVRGSTALPSYMVAFGRSTLRTSALTTMGPWPLYLKRTVTTKGTIKAPYEGVLDVLKDPPSIITLNPLVTGYEAKPDELMTYVITDTVKWLFFAFQTTYTAKAEVGEDGTTFHVKASGGMTSINNWTVHRQADQPDVVEAIEESHVEALFFFIPFIIRTIKSSHSVLMERLTARLQSRQERAARVTTDG